MKVDHWVVVLVCAGLGFAQAQGAPPPQVQGQGPAQGRSGWQGQRGGRGGMMGNMMGGGTVGTVTEIGADHFTIKSELGDVYTVHFSVNTRMMKQPAWSGPRRGQGTAGEGQGFGPGEGFGRGEGEMRTPPQPIKPADIKAGDVIIASGEVDAGARSVGAVFILLMDPERAKEMRAMEANYGKTWLAGRVTSINEVKVNLEGGPERGPHSFVADENTAFRKRRDPITLGDVQVGDMVRVEGSVKDGTFVAATVNVMMPPPDQPRGGDGPGEPAMGPLPGGPQ